LQNDRFDFVQIREKASSQNNRIAVELVRQLIIALGGLLSRERKDDSRVAAGRKMGGQLFP